MQNTDMIPIHHARPSIAVFQWPSDSWPGTDLSPSLSQYVTAGWTGPALSPPLASKNSSSPRGHARPRRYLQTIIRGREHPTASTNHRHRMPDADDGDNTHQKHPKKRESRARHWPAGARFFSFSLPARGSAPAGPAANFVFDLMALIMIHAAATTLSFPTICRRAGSKPAGQMTFFPSRNDDD